MSWIDKVFINNLRCLLFPKYFAAYISRSEEDIKNPG